MKKFQPLEIRRRRLLLLGACAALCAAPVVAEELVAFSSSHEGIGAWRMDGLRVEATNGALRFTLAADGVGRASVQPHLPALPDGLVRVFGRGAGSVRLQGGVVETNLVPRGWDEPNDWRLPAEVPAWRAEVVVAGAAGAMFELRELLVTGRLDMEPALWQAEGAAPGAWHALDRVDYLPGGVRVRGAVESAAGIAWTNTAVAAVRVDEVTGGGVDVYAAPISSDGRAATELVLGRAGEAGLHVFPFERMAWPAGHPSFRLGVRGADGASSARVTSVVVGRQP